MPTPATHEILLPWWLRGWSIFLQCRRPGFSPWVGKIPWRRKWQPTSVLLPGKFHRWRTLVGYSSWGCKELDMTEWLHFHFLEIHMLKPQSLMWLYLEIGPMKRWWESNEAIRMGPYSDSGGDVVRWKNTGTLSLDHFRTQQEGSHTQARKKALTWN